MSGLFGKKRARPLGEEQDDAVPVEATESEEAPPRGAPDGPGMPPAAGAPSEGGGDLTDKIVKNGMRLMYSKPTLPGIIRSLDGGGNPVAGMMTTLGVIVTRLIESAEDKGAALPPDAMLGAAGQLVEKLAELSKSAGAHVYTPEELQQVGQAVTQAIASGGGEAPPEAGPPGDPAAMPPTQPQPPRRGLMA